MKPAVLALPWPAWHTGPDASAFTLTRDLSDSALLEMVERHESFIAEHHRHIPSPSGWRLSREQYNQTREVESALEQRMAMRWREATRKRMAGARKAVSTRRWRQRESAHWAKAA